MDGSRVTTKGKAEGSEVETCTFSKTGTALVPRATRRTGPVCGGLV